MTDIYEELEDDYGAIRIHSLAVTVETDEDRWDSITVEMDISSEVSLAADHIIIRWTEGSFVAGFDLTDRESGKSSLAEIEVLAPYEYRDFQDVVARILDEELLESVMNEPDKLSMIPCVIGPGAHFEGLMKAIAIQERVLELSASTPGKTNDNAGS